MIIVDLLLGSSAHVGGGDPEWQESFEQHLQDELSGCLDGVVRDRQLGQGDQLLQRGRADV